MKPYIFRKNGNFYCRFVVPARFLLGKTPKQKTHTFSLGSVSATQARLSSALLESQMIEIFKGEHMSFDFDDLMRKAQSGQIRKYEIDTERGTVKASDPDDHNRAMEAIREMRALRQAMPAPVSQPAVVYVPAPAPAPVPVAGGITLMEVLDKLLMLKEYRPATVTAYKAIALEFSQFVGGKCHIANVLPSDFVRFQEHLRTEKGNSTRTTDSKITNLKTIFNFAVGHSYIDKSPAVLPNLLTKRQKDEKGYDFFEMEDIRQIFNSESFKSELFDKPKKPADPSFYWCCILAVLTGCRSNELSTLKRSQIKITENGTNYLDIEASKTRAGVRQVPLIPLIFKMGFADFIADKLPDEQIFKYEEREGKGAGNAVGKKFKRLIESERLTGKKLVFHSLRKFFNEFLSNTDIKPVLVYRLMGHEIPTNDKTINLTNEEIYKRKLKIDKIYELVGSELENLANAIGFKAP